MLLLWLGKETTPSLLCIYNLIPSLSRNHGKCLTIFNLNVQSIGLRFAFWEIVNAEICQNIYLTLTNFDLNMLIIYIEFSFKYLFFYSIISYVNKTYEVFRQYLYTVLIRSNFYSFLFEVFLTNDSLFWIDQVHVQLFTAKTNSVKNVQIRDFFSWYVFSLIRTDYVDLQISVFSPNIRKCGPEKTPQSDTFTLHTMKRLFNYLCLHTLIIGKHSGFNKIQAKESSIV